MRTVRQGILLGFLALRREEGEIELSWVIVTGELTFKRLKNKS